MVQQYTNISMKTAPKDIENKEKNLNKAKLERRESRLNYKASPRHNNKRDSRKYVKRPLF